MSLIWKSSVGFNLLFYLLHATGLPSLPYGLNCSSESLMQSKRTLLWMCSHSAKKFLNKSSLLGGLSGYPFGFSSFWSLVAFYFNSSSLLSFLLLSKVRYKSSGKTCGYTSSKWSQLPIWEFCNWYSIWTASLLRGWFRLSMNYLDSACISAWISSTYLSMAKRSVCIPCPWPLNGSFTSKTNDGHRMHTCHYSD